MYLVFAQFDCLARRLELDRDGSRRHNAHQDIRCQKQHFILSELRYVFKMDVYYFVSFELEFRIARLDRELPVGHLPGKGFTVLQDDNVFHNVCPSCFAYKSMKGTAAAYPRWNLAQIENGVNAAGEISLMD